MARCNRQFRGITHASNDAKQLVCVRLWQTTTGVHLVNDERDIACAEFFNEQVAEEVVVP